jgi:hypothetical protein
MDKNVQYSKSSIEFIIILFKVFSQIVGSY